MNRSDELEYISDDGEACPMEISLNCNIFRFWSASFGQNEESTTSSIQQAIDDTSDSLSQLLSTPEAEDSDREESKTSTESTKPNKGKSRPSCRSNDNDHHDSSEDSPSLNRKKMKAALTSSAGLAIHAMAESFKA